MGLIDRLAERLFKDRLLKLQQEQVSKALGSDFYAALLKYVNESPVYMAEGTDAYVREGYLFNPTVYSIISFIAQKASTIPFGVYEVKNDKMLNLYKNASPNLERYKKEAVKTKAMVELPDHDLNQLFISPNVLQGWAEFIEQVVGYKLVTGNSYVHCIGPTAGPNSGTIKEMWTLPSQAVTIVAGDRYQPIRMYQMIGDPSVNIPPEQVIHLKYWTPEYDSGRFLYGLSPIRAGRRVVTKSNAAFDSWVSSFQNFGVRGILSPEPSTGPTDPFTEEQQEMLEKRFSKKTGPHNAGKPLIASVPLRWQQTGMSPVDLAIIESDKMDLRTICNLFHVPSELFNDASNKTYSNTKEAGSAVYTNAVIPALTQFRDAMNMFIRPRYQDKIFVDYDTSMVSELQDDLQYLTTALSGAWWIKPNERRDLMSFPADEENELMNEYWVPAGLSPMTEPEDIEDEAIDEAEKALGIKDYE